MKYKKQIKFLKESLNKWKIKNFKSDFRRKKKTNGELSITFTTNINNNDFFLNKHLM